MMSSFSFNPLILFQNWPEPTRDWATMNKLETGGDEEALSSAHQVKVGEMVVKILIWWYCHQDFDFMVVNILIWWCLPPGESESGWDGGFWCDDIRHQDFDLMVVKILILWWSRFWFYGGQDFDLMIFRRKARILRSAMRRRLQQWARVCQVSLRRYFLKKRSPTW